MAVNQFVLACIVVLLCAAISASPVQNPDFILSSRDLRARNFRSGHSNNGIGFNIENSGISHTTPNLNPLPPTVSVEPVFRPAFSNRNSVSPIRYPSNTFRSPVAPSTSNVPQTMNISITNNPKSLQSSRNPSRNTETTCTNTGHRGKCATLSFSNKPAPNPTQITDADRHAPISFGIPRMSSTGVTFISNEPQVGQPTDFIETNPTAESHFSSTTMTEGTSFGMKPVTGSFFSPSSTPPIVFPGYTSEPGFDRNTFDPNYTNDDLTNDGECDLKHRKVYYDDDCYTLLHQGPCSDHHWLILSSDGTPYCSEKECSWDTLYYNGECVDPNDFDVCKPGQILYVDLSGDAECDCEPDFIYDPISKNCYAEHDQGFCRSTYFMQRNENGQIMCVANPCLSDGFVAHQRKCYVKNYIGTCPPSQVRILEDGTADCLFIVPHSIFDVPTLRACPSGSKRDFFHKCRAVFRVPTLVSSRSLGGKCPSGFTRDPRGTCRKVHSLFG